jgi:hypothetical protein
VAPAEDGSSVEYWGNTRLLTLGLEEGVFALVGVATTALNFLGRRQEGGELVELGGETSPEASASVTSTSAASSSEEGGLETGRDFLPLFLEAEAP